MIIGAAGNTATCALGELRALGFTVTDRGDHYVAERPGLTLTGGDTLQLLGLAVLVERRGEAAQCPTDTEVGAMLALSNAV